MTTSVYHSDSAKKIDEQIERLERVCDNQSSETAAT